MEIQTLLTRKINGEELDLEPRIVVIHDFLEKEMAHLTNYAKTLDTKPEDPTEYLDQLFRDALDEAWK